MSFATLRTTSVVVLILVAVACALFGGLGNPVDVTLIRDGIAARAASPLPTEAGVFLNYAGGASATISLGVIAALLLWRRDGARLALIVAAIMIGGRLLVEGIKVAVHRARPALDAHPVTLHSLSFPSAHAANSMIFFPLLALLFAPRGHRAPWILLGVAVSLIVGASRSLIGVHWPSDVIAGWAIGAAWLIASWPFAAKLVPVEPQHYVVGGHRTPLAEK